MARNGRSVEEVRAALAAKLHDIGLRVTHKIFDAFLEARIVYADPTAMERSAGQAAKVRWQAGSDAAGAAACVRCPAGTLASPSRHPLHRASGARWAAGDSRAPCLLGHFDGSAGWLAECGPASQYFDLPPSPPSHNSRSPLRPCPSPSWRPTAAQTHFVGYFLEHGSAEARGSLVKALILKEVTVRGAAAANAYLERNPGANWEAALKVALDEQERHRAEVRQEREKRQAAAAGGSEPRAATAAAAAGGSEPGAATAAAASEVDEDDEDEDDEVAGAGAHAIH